jgi:valyl-tRNA synthetase
MLDKTYSPADIEARWYAHWETSGVFAAGQSNGALGNSAPTYTIVIPPPNVTGSLHMGHALNNTLQDVLIRYHRMKGYDVLWQPGTDHAGIATQMVVERQLEAQGVKRAELGRGQFLSRVWSWKEESGGTITGQLRRLGASCDWGTERFTMDPGFSAAVIKTFVELHRQGLIYRDKRLVNWDPKLKTSISDLEVEQREVQGKMWHFRYPLEDGSGFIAIATTRPETILGDGAVAVNPKDDRYSALIGKHCRLPIVDRLIPIIADDYVEMDFGSGAVKITAAHDFNDYAVAMRHPEVSIPLINLMNPDASMSNACPADYRGLDRYEARKKVIADFEALGLLDQIEELRHNVPYGDRSGVVIEPYLTDQWYVDAKTLAKAAIEAVDSGQTKFVPSGWKKTWDEWMLNIQPWCISRQLWWGHQIPAWYGDDGRIFVAETFDEAQAQAGEGVALRQDEDVLDTWFSSALWPFATLGWPEKTERLARHYPNTVLVTGFDIIFFWVARMMMQGIHFMGKPPFATVYVHGLVRDDKGQKMSKSKGNVKDPLEFIDKYGADALRFFMAAMETQGRDIKLSEARVEGYRNFGTKLWNAARFCQMNGIAGSSSAAPPTASLTVNRWIIAEVARLVAELDAAFAAYRFSEAANTVYQFIWATFCDWYIELTKPALQGEDGPAKDETRAVAGWALDQILVCLHPFMPFITEELWHALADRPNYDLITARWPVIDASVADEAARSEIDWLVRVISGIRSARMELNVSPAVLLPCVVAEASSATAKRLQVHKDALVRLARLASLETGSPALKGTLQVVIDEATFVLPLGDVIDLEAERARLAKSRDKLAGEAKALEGRLANEAFVAKAPAAVIAENREQLADKLAQVARLSEALARLGSTL